MIFIINETNKQLKLKASEVDKSTILSVLINDAELPVVGTSDPDISKVIMDRFTKPEVIRNQRSKYNFWVEGKMLLIEQPDCDEQIQPECYLIAVNYGDSLPERYTTSKDLIAVIHPHDKEIDMHSDNLTFSTKYEYATERNEFDITIFPIKWYDWSRLKKHVLIHVDGTPAYQLSSTPHKEDGDRRVNVISDVRKKYKK